MDCQAQIDAWCIVSCQFSVLSSYVMASFKLWRLEILWKTNLVHGVGIHDTNLDFRELKKETPANVSKLLPYEAVKTAQIV